MFGVSSPSASLLEARCPAFGQRTPRKSAFGLAVVAGVIALGGCGLPAQQLALPGPLAGSVPGSITPAGATTSRSGVPVSDTANSKARTPDVILGSGSFTSNASASPAGSGGDSTDDPGRGGSQAGSPTGGSPTGGSPAGAAGSSPNGKAGVTVSDEGVTLSLAGASIPEVARTVLGDVLGLNYAVAEGVKGSITLQTSEPIPRRDLLKLFETLMRQEGAVLLVDNGLYRIVPSEGARAGGVRGRPREAGLTNVAIPLRHIAPAEMQRILGSVVPQSTSVQVDENRNLLLVSGIPNEIASVRETVATFDVDWMRGMSFAILPLESADPVAIAQELDTIFANDRSSPTKGIARFVPNQRLKSVLVISSRPAFIAKAREWVKRLDLVGQENAKQVQVYRVQNRPATEVAALLQKVYMPQGDRAGGDARGAIAPGQAAATLSSVGDGIGAPTGLGSAPAFTVPRNAAGEPQPIPPVTPFPVTAPTTGGDGSPSSSGLGPASAGSTTGAPATTGSIVSTVPDDRTSGIQVVADDTNNSVIVTATRSEFKRVKAVIAQLDVAPAQVLLEATIAEVTLNDNLRFGLRWFFQNGNNRASLTDLATGAVTSRFPGFSYFLNTPNIQVALNALSDVTKVDIVSSPSLTVLDNKKALLQIGDEVPIATQSAVSIVAPGAPIVNTVSFRSTGVILGITPRIGENGRVLLDIEQEVSNVTATTSSSIDSPTIQQRRIKTQVAVGSGESVVLAGFIQDRAEKGQQQVPLLGNLPVLGNLFKDKDDRIRRTELLIAITPQILTDPNQIRGVAAEFRDRLNLTTRPQRQAPPDLHEQIDRVLVR
ncbi:MAG: type II secretion system secretin GspD [Hyphomicrobium aestuarii]|nr:type II secretion system secretin GspD [Hyphomicrobium aestuarii]